MARPLTAGMQTAVAAETGDFCLLLEFQFSGGTLRYTSGSTTLPAASWDPGTLGIAWTAIGGAVWVETVEESPDLAGHGATVHLSGVDQAILSTLLTDKSVGRTVKIYLAHFNASGALIADPLPFFVGRMNGGWRVREDWPRERPGTVSIEGRMTSLLADLAQVRGIETNVESHQAVFAGDTFFDFVPTLEGKRIMWGGRTVILATHKWPPQTVRTEDT